MKLDGDADELEEPDALETTANGPPDAITSESSVTPRARSPLLKGASLTLLLVIAACIGGAASSWLWSEPPPPPEPEVVIVHPSPDVIVALRDLARLESAAFQIERIVEIESRQRHLFGLLEAGDSLLLIASGEVIAGVDLTEMSDGDVILEPEAERATLILPPPRLLVVRLDNERTRVASRHTDLLARREESLETRARREAERTLRQAALDGGLLERARANAAQSVETLVRALGYRDVVIRFRVE